MSVRFPWVCIIPGSNRAFGERLGCSCPRGPGEPKGLQEMEEGVYAGPPAGWGPGVQPRLLGPPPLPVQCLGWRPQECTDFQG